MIHITPTLEKTLGPIVRAVLKKIAVITTGGTIASRADASGAQVAAVPGADLLASVTIPAGVTVEVRDLFSVNSYAMALSRMDQVRWAVNEALLEPQIQGVVVAHGTDTLEETAFLIELFHSDPSPVVFTGAQRSADTPGSDGPGNLRDAIALAASPAAVDLGVLIMFDGVVHSARGARKTHTTALAAFSDPDFGPVGHLERGELVLHSRPVRRAPLGFAIADFTDIQVDIVTLYPGVSATALDAYAAAGARGLVLEATGMGNANPELVAAVARHVAAGVQVILSTRVNAGPVRPVYGGGGGGYDLVAAGAISAGYLRPSQARIQLASLLACGANNDQILHSFLPDPHRAEANQSAFPYSA